MEYCVMLSTQREGLIFFYHRTSHLPTIMTTLTNSTYFLLYLSRGEYKSGTWNLSVFFLLMLFSVQLCGSLLSFYKDETENRLVSS